MNLTLSQTTFPNLQIPKATEWSASSGRALPPPGNRPPSPFQVPGNNNNANSTSSMFSNATPTPSVIPSLSPTIGVANHTKQSILGSTQSAPTVPSTTSVPADPYANTLRYDTATGLPTAYGKSLGLGQSAYNTPVNNTPDANGLSGTNPITVPQTIPNPTIQGGLRATSDSAMTTPKGYSVDEKGNLSIRENPNDVTGRSDILGRVLGDTKTLGQKGQATNDLNANMGVDTKAQNYIDAYNAYNSKKVSYAQQEEAYKNSNQGGLQSGADKTFAVIQRQNNADLANLSIIAQAAQGNYTTAIDIVKRKIDAEFEPIQTEIDNLSKFIDTNNADLTNSEKTKLENQRYILQKNLDTLIEAKTSAHQFALQQGITDPQILSRIDAATNPTEAYSAVGMSSNGESSSSQGNGTYGAVQANVTQENQNYIDRSSDGVLYVDQGRLQNMTPYQKQIASQQFAKAGVRVLDTNDVQALTTIDSAKQNLNLFESTANRLLSSGFFGRIKGFTTNQLAQLSQTNPDWRQFQTLRAGLIKSVQGVAAGAPGLRVTGAELANAAEALPNSSDNLESAQQAVNTFRQLLDVNRNVLLRGSAPTGNSNSQGGGNSGRLYDF